MYCRGFTSTDNSVIFQEHHCAILNTFWVAILPANLSLCFREHSLQGTLVAWRLPLQSSALQTDQSWQKLDLKVDVVILCNMTSSFVHTSFGQLHHRLNILRFKDRLPILFKTPFGTMRLKGRLDTGSDYGIRTEITKPQRGKKNPTQNGEHCKGGICKTTLRL